MTSLRRMEHTDKDAVLSLAVSNEQLAYVDPLSKTLSVSDDRFDNHVATADGQAVGFFQIHRLSEEGSEARILTVEELSVGMAHQGKGYGKRLIGMMRSYLS